MSLASLTPELLYRHRWEYGPAASGVVWGTLRFAPASLPPLPEGEHGRIFGYGHPNERRWRFADGALVLMSDHRLATNRFDEELVIDGRTTLRGRHLLEHGGVHELRAVSELSAWPEPDIRLAIDKRLNDASRPLVVIFNSMGNPLEEDGSVRWEYYRFTADPAIDFLRFAEPLKPASWYLRADPLVREALREAAAGRRRVILAGNSSGGYAAIRFGQWMTDARLVPEVRTIAVNPQTAHTLPHRLHLWGREWDHFLPATIDDDVLRLTGRADVDLADILASAPRRRFRTVKHTVLFDSDNPVECYYTGLISNQPDVQVRSMPIGMSHVRGIHEMELRGVMKTMLREAVDAASSWRSFVATMPRRSRALVRRARSGLRP